MIGILFLVVMCLLLLCSIECILSCLTGGLHLHGKNRQNLSSPTYNHTNIGAASNFNLDTIRSIKKSQVTKENYGKILQILHDII